MPIRIFLQPISVFAQRISYQSTCVRLRTTVISKQLSGHCGVEETKRYSSEELTVDDHLQSESCDYCPREVSRSLIGHPEIVEHRMPVVAAVVAHRRVYPDGSSVGSAPGSQRSSCAVKLSALSILAPPLGAAGLTSVCRTTSSKFSVSAFTRDSGRCQPIFDLKQLGAFLKGPKGAAVITETRRYYAKGKDKPKSKKAAVLVNENEMGEVIDVDQLRKQLEKLMEEMKEEFAKQLNVRGAAGALEALQVEFDGEVYPLQELAQVGRKNPQLAVLNLASLPDALQPVLKAISDSGMNLNPQQEGTTIYVPLPKVTREHRETLAKNAKAMFTKYKTSMQGVQNKFVKQCRSQKDLSEDLLFGVQQQIMKFTENYVSDAEKLMLMKQKELLENK